MAKLTLKQKIFSQEYIIDLNATQAAIRAGYSPKTAMEQGYQLLHKTSVKQEIEKIMVERQKSSQITASQIIIELRKIAFAQSGVNIQARLKALELLGRHLGIFSQKDFGQGNIEVLFQIPRPQVKYDNH